jgi:hypothetical protein
MLRNIGDTPAQQLVRASEKNTLAFKAHRAIAYRRHVENAF